MWRQRNYFVRDRRCQDLAAPATGEQEQPNRCDRRRFLRDFSVALDWLRWKGMNGDFNV